MSMHVVHKVSAVNICWLKKTEKFFAAPITNV